MQSIYEQEITEAMEYSNDEIIARTNQLSKAEKKEIDREFSYYEYIDSVALESLRIVQKYRGWISDETLRLISDYLNFPITKLESVATCYQLIFRQPVGKKVIYLCNSASCWIMGFEEIKATLEYELKISCGETTEDKLFTMLQTPCLGNCDKAPVMMLGKEMHNNLTVDGVKEIVSSYNFSKEGCSND